MVNDEMTSYPIPVSIGSEVVVHGKFPLSESEWEQFMVVLTAMRPGLVRTSAVDPLDECLVEPVGNP